MTDIAKKNSTKSSLAARSVQKMLNNKLAMLGLIITILMVLMAVFAPMLTKYDPNATNTKLMNLPPGGEHLFGTDSIGRDLYARLLYGGRVSIVIGVVSALLTSIIGTTLGLIAGYFRGKIDSILVRVSEIIQTFPMTILVLILVSIVGAGIKNLIMVFCFTGWMTVFRIVRNEVLRLREETYVEVNKAFGIKDTAIMFGQILPNTLSPIIVATTINTAFFILEETALSFLGLGVPTNVPTWGTIINAAKSLSVIKNQWWLWVIPGATISLFVMSVNFLGDGLRDVLDPKI